MSFFSCSDNSNVPGPINGSALNGLCERACVLVHRVFDSGIIQREAVNQTVEITGVMPENPALPLNFVSAQNVGSDATIQNLIVTRLGDRPNFARISGDAIIPIVVNYTDANGFAGSGFSTVSVPFDIILFVPQDALVPYEIQASAGAVFPIGEYVSGLTFNLVGCVNLIIRVVVRAQILVPTYGYCLIPTATQFNEDICRGFFDRPLYPSGLSQNNSNSN